MSPDLSNKSITELRLTWIGFIASTVLKENKIKFEHSILWRWALKFLKEMKQLTRKTFLIETLPTLSLCDGEDRNSVKGLSGSLGWTILSSLNRVLAAESVKISKAYQQENKERLYI